MQFSLFSDEILRWHVLILCVASYGREFKGDLTLPFRKCERKKTGANFGLWKINLTNSSIFPHI